MGRPLPDMLDDALDGARVEPALRAAACARFGARATIGVPSIEVLRRSVMRYSVPVRAPEGGEPRAWTVIGKVYASAEAGRRGRSALRWLWEQGFAERAPDSVSVPAVYAYAPELQLLLMEEVAGEPLKQLLGAGLAGPEHMRLLAEALAKLHGFPARYGPPFTVEDHLAVRCANLAGPLAQAFPAESGSIARIVDAARRHGPGELALCHGDFHPGQVHVDGGRAWILDLDPLHTGDPAYDVAMVLFALKQLRRGRLPVERTRELRDAFLAAYFARVDRALAARLPVNLALIHLKRACKRFRWQDEEGWEATIPLQLRQAVECVAVAETARAPRDLADVAALDERCPAED